MSTWFFMLGLQMILFIATFVWVVVWMTRKPDDLDRKLDEMNAANDAALAERVKKMDAEKGAKS